MSITRYTYEALDAKAKSRPAGYLAEMIQNSTKIDNNTLEIDTQKMLEIDAKWRLPSYLQMIKNLASAAQSAAASGLDVRNGEETEAALSLCATCPYLVEDGFRCGHCGCYLDYKVKLKSWHCPINKW